jgi:hypothetical protein
MDWYSEAREADVAAARKAMADEVMREEGRDIPTPGKITRSDYEWHADLIRDDDGGSE